MPVLVAYSLNHLVYSGAGNVAPAPLSATCALVSDDGIATTKASSIKSTIRGYSPVILP